MDTNIIKGFSCLKMKEEIQAKIYEEVKDMTPEERVAYFHIPVDQDPFRGNNVKKSTPQPRTSVRRAVPRKRKELA